MENQEINPEVELQYHETRVYLVTAPPDEVDAGTDMPLKVGVSCPEGCNLQGSKVTIVDAEGTSVGQADLLSVLRTVNESPVEMAGETTEAAVAEMANETDEFVVKAPVEPGLWTWMALFSVHESDGVRHEECLQEFTFKVRPHLMTMAVWGVPAPVTKGKEFAVNIGARCSAGCSLAGLPFEIVDDKGKPVLTGELGEDLLPETNSLYWSEQRPIAPAEDGLYKWTVECQASGLELPHQVKPRSFTFRTVPPPDHVATVEVVDQRKKTPLKDVTVLLNPRRAFTDENGVAKIEVSTGQHELYLKKQDYIDYKAPIEVAGDVTIRVEMIFYPEPTD